MPIGKLALDTNSNYVKASGLASGQILTKVATKEVASFSMLGAGAASAGGNVLQSTSNALMMLTVGFGVGFSVLDIVILVDAWSTKHPTAEAIEKIINKIKDEINRWQNISTDIYKYTTIIEINQFHRIVENDNEKQAQRERERERESEMKQEESNESNYLNYI
jgi:hypothetical protein